MPRRYLTAIRRRGHSAVMRVYSPVAIRLVRGNRRWRCRGLALNVPVGVFHPGLFFSSAVLAAEIERRRPRGRSVLDVGCGSGVLALTAARCGAVVTAVDINPAAVAAATANATANGLAVTVVQSDLFAAVDGRQFDMVVVNPPYFAKDPVDDAERAWFAGSDLGYFERFFAGLADHLAAEAVTLMVLGEGCDIATISAAAKRHGFSIDETRRKRVWLGIQVVYEISTIGR
jgi:release factor glutamine methyltransferase